MYTSHGHHIPGTVKETPGPTHRARCGGTRMCRVCMSEVDASHEIMSKAPKTETRMGNVKVPLVKYEDGERKVIGEAMVEFDDKDIIVSTVSLIPGYSIDQDLSISIKEEG